MKEEERLLTKMKTHGLSTRRIALAGLLVCGIAGFPAAASAQGVPTEDIGTRIQSAAQHAEALRQEAQEHLEKLLQLKSQFDELVRQGAQAIQNARALGDIGRLTDELRQYSDLLNTDAARTVMSQFYGIASDAANFKDQARQKLGQIFDLPRSDNDIRDILARAGSSPIVAESIASSNGLLLQEQDGILNSVQSIGESARKSQQARENLNAQTVTLGGLGDNSLAAMTHLGVGVQIQQGYQLNQVVEELRAQRAENARRHLKELQEEKQALENALRHQQELDRIRTERVRAIPFSEFGN